MPQLKVENHSMNIKRKGFPEILKAARRQLHASKTLREGISIVRHTLTPVIMPSLVKALSATPIYKSVLAVNPFPKDFKSFTSSPRLSNIPLEGEIYWTASVLSLFSTEINEFVKTRDIVRKSLMNGEYQTGLSELDSFQERYGVSLWMLSTRLQLLQLLEGLKAQKDYLEQTINIHGLNTFAAWFAFYFSLRSEENVSYITLLDTLSNLIETPKLGDYVRHHILPGDVEEIREPEILITWEEPNPIFDRYETFLSTLGMFMIQDGREDIKHLLDSLDLLVGVLDSELTYLRSINQHGLGASISGTAIGLYDDYHKGALKPSPESFINYPEISARALACTGDAIHHVNLSEEIVSCMKDILLGEDSYKLAHARLQKIGLLAGDRRKATAISYFLRRADNRTAMEDASIPNGAVRAAIQSGPWVIDELPEIEWEHEFHVIASRFPDSLFTHLGQAKLLDCDDALTGLQALSLPPDREALISGKLLLGRNEHAKARKFLHVAAKNNRNLVTVEAMRYLLVSYLHTGEIEAAIELVAAECLDYGGAYRLLPVDELLTLALREGTLFSSVHLAIVLSVAARLIDPHWERDLSDIFENTLTEQGVARPSELTSKSTSWSTRELIYFLRYIAVPRVLDDLIDFESIEEIEEERIKICQHLIVLDEKNSDFYSGEIRSITREAKIFRTLNTVEASKIFVDENGIKGAVAEQLGEAFSRFQILAKSPELSYQADKISKRLTELLRDAPADLRGYYPAQSEREGLLDSMLTIFMNEFALNPAYGLDTHVSTTIRHGAIEGNIRTPLVAFDLLCGRENEKYLIAPRWNAVFEIDAGLNEVTKILTKLTIRVEEQIQRCNNEILCIYTESCPKGLFNFYMTAEARRAFRDTLDASEPYDEVVAKLFRVAWSLVATSLEAIRNELLIGVGTAINVSIDSAIASLSNREGNAASELRDALTRSKTRFQSDLESTANWFQLPRDLVREDFEFDIAVAVALQQIRHCYIRNYITPQTSISLKGKFAGRHLDGLVEIMFILLQNVIRHSGSQSDEECQMVIAVSEIDGQATVSVINQVAMVNEISKVKCNAESAVSDYNYDSAMKRAREEGGSGLSKVWRIAQYDLRCTHALEINVNEQERVFEVRMTLGGLR